MTGILLLIVVAIWLAIVVWIGRAIFRRLPLKPWRMPVALLLSLLLLPMPLIDEIVGGQQFARLCRENSEIQVDRAKAIGKTVFLADSADVEIKGTWVRVVLTPWRYVDAATGETVVSYNTLLASGGKFIHALGISEGGAPLTFKSYCGPNNDSRANLSEDLRINEVDRPKTNIGKTK